MPENDATTLDGRRWRSLLALPDAITWLALLCGLGALHLAAVSGRLGAAFGLLFLAAVFDVCDGAVARRLGKARDFGGYFDFMVDTIVFLPAASVVTYQAGMEVLVLHVLFNSCGALRHARLLACPGTKKLGLPSTMSGFTFPLVYLVTRWLDLDPALAFGVWTVVLSAAMASLVNFRRLPFLAGGVARDGGEVTG